MKLSVIVPVYRVEATLDRCVESVLKQDVDDMEVILVDDGSPDNCPEMCDRWAVEDQRIKVVHKQNGGLSDARNAGLDMATGDYVTFVDSDDYLAPGTYGSLMELLMTGDIVEYSITDRLQLQDACYDDADKYWLETQAYTHTYAWNKIYRRSLFEDVRYPVGKVFEDVYTLPLLLRKATRIVTTSRGFYHYTYNEQGITASANANGQGLAMLLDAHLKSRMPVDDIYYMYMVNIQMDVWERTSTPILLPPRRVRTAGLDFNKKLKAIALNTIGIKRLCKLNKMLHKVKRPSRW
jgi:glycosyltransferase involved in cell wall biosynthesis